MRKRRAIAVFVIGTLVLILFAGALPSLLEQPASHTPQATAEVAGSAQEALDALEVKGRAPKTGYARAQFGDGWSTVNGCTTRNIILHRDLENTTVDEACRVVSGTLHDPYSGETIQFSKDDSSKVQIDHVVALSDAWQKGAQTLTKETREQLANDPLELLAVQGAANQAKSDGDAATWLPKNKAFRCEYVARQIAVKKKYSLWVTDAEREAMRGVLSACPSQGALSQ